MRVRGIAENTRLTFADSPALGADPGTPDTAHPTRKHGPQTRPSTTDRAP